MTGLDLEVTHRRTWIKIMLCPGAHFADSGDHSLHTALVDNQVADSLAAGSSFCSLHMIGFGHAFTVHYWAFWWWCWGWFKCVLRVLLLGRPRIHRRRIHQRRSQRQRLVSRRTKQWKHQRRSQVTSRKPVVLPWNALPPERRRWKNRLLPALWKPTSTCTTKRESMASNTTAAKWWQSLPQTIFEILAPWSATHCPLQIWTWFKCFSTIGEARGWHFPWPIDWNCSRGLS